MFEIITDLLPSITSLSNLLIIHYRQDNVQLYIYIFKILFYAFFLHKAFNQLRQGKKYKTQSLKYYIITTVINLLIYIWTARAIERKLAKLHKNDKKTFK